MGLIKNISFGIIFITSSILVGLDNFSGHDLVDENHWTELHKQICLNLKDDKQTQFKIFNNVNNKKIPLYKYISSKRPSKKNKEAYEAYENLIGLYNELISEIKSENVIL